jgi:hypothetical protein
MRTLQRRVDFLKSRDHKNSFDLAELGALEWAIVNLQPAPVQDSTCNETLRAQGKAYPRTCKKCGLGPCIGAPKPAAAPVQEPDYAWPTVDDYEKDVGFQVGEAFKMAWNMARTTNGFLKLLSGEAPSPAAQRTWVELSSEDKKIIRNNVGYDQFMTAGEYAHLVQEATEIKLKELNT